MQPIAIFCADVGSEAEGKFGWAGIDGGAWTPGKSLEHLAENITHVIQDNRKAALGLECPLYIPFDEIVNGSRRIGASRCVDRTEDGWMPWAAPAGATVALYGLQQLTWVLHTVKDRCGKLFQPALVNDTTLDRESNFYLWEAFVSGQVKKRPLPKDFTKHYGNNVDLHVKDSVLGAECFYRWVEQSEKERRPPERRDAGAVISLAGLALNVTGCAPPEALTRPVYVFRPSGK